MINEKNPQKAIEQVRKSSPPIFVKAQDEKFNRRILEYGRFDMLVFPEARHKKTKLKKADASINHVSAKIATKNKVALGYDLKELRKLDKKQKAQELTVIRSDIRYAKKAKTTITLLNTKDKKNGDAVLLSLGASTTQLK